MHLHLALFGTVLAEIFLAFLPLCQQNTQGTRPPKLITASKQFPQEASRERTQRTRAKSLGLSKNTSDDTTVHVGTNAVHNGPGKTKAKRVDRMQSAKRSHTHKTTMANNPKESVICLTQDQLQQILRSIDKTTFPEEQKEAHSKAQIGKISISPTY